MGIFDCFKPHVKQISHQTQPAPQAEEERPGRTAAAEKTTLPQPVTPAPAARNALAAEALDGLQAALLSADAHSWLRRISGLLRAFEERGMCARLYGLVETASGLNSGTDWDLVLIAVGAHAAAASAAALSAVAGPPCRSSGSTVANAASVAMEEGVRMEILSQAYNVRAPVTRVLYPRDAYAPSPLAPAGTSAGAAGAAGVRCMAVLPLMQGDRMVGALLLEERPSGGITSGGGGTVMTLPSDAPTSMSVLSTGLGPPAIATHVPASGPRALTALGNTSSSVVVVSAAAASGPMAARVSGKDLSGGAGVLQPSPAGALLRDMEMLRALSFTASMCLMGSGSDKLLWLAQAVIRLRSAGSLQALVWELVEAVVAHVKRRFILDAYAGVAVVPPAQPLASGVSASAPIGIDAAGSPLPSVASPPPPQPEAKPVLGLLLRLQPGAGLGAPVVGEAIGSCSADEVVEGAAAGESTGGGSAIRSASRRRRSLTMHTGRGSAPTTPTAAAATAAVAAAAVAAAGTPQGVATGGGASIGTAANSNSNSPWRAGPPGEADTGASVRSISRFFASLAGGMGGTGSGFNTGGTPRPNSGAHYAGLGSMAGRNPSAASVIIPLSAADMATVNAAAAGAGTSPAALHANAFPMQHTLLAAVLALRQQAAAALRERERLLSLPSMPITGGGGADAAAQAAVAATAQAAAATAAVIDDTQLYVQGVHNPSRDVVLLCSVLAQAHAAGAHHPAPATPPAAGGAAGAQQTRASTANGMLGAGVASPTTGPTSNGASGAASGAVTMTSGNFAAAATAALGSAASGPPAPPQSLVLLTLALDRTGTGEPGGLAPSPPLTTGGAAAAGSDAGAALGLYVCFARRLPAALLEAVRESCQELLDEALASPFRERLRGPLAPEYELLKQAQVGTYAVLRGAGLGGPTAGDDVLLTTGASGHGGSVRAGTALLESLLGRSRRLAAAVTGGGAGGTTGTALSPNSTLSSYLSTADLEAVPGQGHDKAAVDAAVRVSSSMRRASLSADPRQGGAVGGHTHGGRATTGSAAAAGQRALHGAAAADLAGRSASVASARSVTLGLAAGTGTSTSMSRNATGGPAAGEGRTLGMVGGGGGVPASLPADDLLDMLMGSCTGDIHATGDGVTPVPARTASIIHVTGVEAGGATAQKQMDLLVSSIQATINASAVGNGVTGGAFASDLEQLELQEVLGRGGGGVVLKGLLNGTLQVAVKLMEMPDVEGEADAAAAAAAPAPPGPDGTPAPAAAAAPNAAKQLRARRELLRNAMELAVQGSASHPNIVQFYSTFNNVVLRSRAPPDAQNGGVTDPRSLYLEPAPPVPEKGDNEARVTCILAEYCDAGSLGAALQSRAFPHLARTPTRVATYGTSSSAFMYDMKGVYMVLLDVALALRHLHSMNLVHRDIKPANLLLKSNPNDYRGFTVKLADFGFVLHLNETGEDGSRFANVDQACGTVTHMAPECMPGKAKIDAAADIYSFGILCWELLAGGVRPFPHVHPDKIPRMVYKGARPTFSDNVPAVYRNLAQQCWCTTPSRRPKAAELVTIITQQLQAL